MVTLCRFFIKQIGCFTFINIIHIEEGRRSRTIVTMVLSLTKTTIL